MVSEGCPKSPCLHTSAWSGSGDSSIWCSYWPMAVAQAALTGEGGDPGRVRPSNALRCWAMAKAARILAALKRDGWRETRRSGSHRVLVKGNQQRILAYHDGVDIGWPDMARIARDYGYTLDELRKL